MAGGATSPDRCATRGRGVLRDCGGDRRAIARVRALTSAAALACAAATLAAGLAHCPAPATAAPTAERYVPELGRIDSVQRALDVLPLYTKGSTDRDLALGIDRLLRDRFVHGYSIVSPCRNWSLALVGLLRPDVTTAMRPDEIMRHPMAACSQQAMVFQALLERVGIDYASIGYRPMTPGRNDGHFTVAAKLDGTWTYFDPNQEPVLASVPVTAVLQGDILPRMYPGRNGIQLQGSARRGDIEMRGINRYPAPRGGLLQGATDLFSRWAWLVLAAASLAMRPRSSRTRFATLHDAARRAGATTQAIMRAGHMLVGAKS